MESFVRPQGASHRPFLSPESFPSESLRNAQTLFPTPTSRLGHKDSPANNSKHFSCNRPFLGIANNTLSFRFSTKRPIADSAPNLDRVAACEVASVLEAATGVGGRVMVLLAISATGVACDEAILRGMRDEGG